MIRLPPRSTRTDTLFPYPTLFRSAARLNALLRLDALPESRLMIVERIRRQIEAKSPLSRGEPEAEAEAFKALVDKLMPEDALFGGSPIAEALSSDERRVGNACVSTCRSRWSPDP